MQNELIKKIKTQNIPIPSHLYDSVIEKTCFGMLILYSKYSDFERLKEDYFYEPKHKNLYRGMKTLYDSQKKFDIVNLVEFADKEELFNHIAHSSLATDFSQVLEQLLNYHIAREAYKLGKSITEKTQDIKVGRELVKTLETEIEIYKEKTTHKNQLFYPEKLVDNWFEVQSQRFQKGTNKDFYFNIEGLEKFFVKPGHLCSLVGRTKAGKTSLMVQTAIDALEKNHPVLFITLEIDQKAITDKIFAFHTGYNPKTIENYGGDNSMGMEDDKYVEYQNKVGVAIGQTTNWLCKKEFAVYHSSTGYINELISIIQEFAKKHPRPVVFVDQLQFINSASKFESLVYEYDFILRKLKKTTIENECMMILAHQLNRDIEKREGKYPQTSDIKSSGRVEEISDLLILFNKDAEKNNSIRYTNVVSRFQEGGFQDMYWNSKKARFYRPNETREEGDSELPKRLAKK